jgi:dTDP-L-rhamnose 4-epimerase
VTYFKKSILITGGAGFIGSHLIRKLLKSNSNIRILDNLSPQVHGQIPQDLEWLNNKNIKFIRDSVTSKKALESALDGVDTVVHLAAETGTGQSMYEISRYFDVNVQGTASLLDVLQNSESGNSIRSIIVASSRAIYGEGSYECPVHSLVFPESRTSSRMSEGDFELYCPECGAVISMVTTGETAPFRPASVYGLTKQVQEQAILMFAKTRGINGFALRYQNVFGPGQSLKNPYTGILSIFSNLARQGNPIEVFEDGLESRDFVFVEDVAEATCQAVNYVGNYVGALNVGSGEAITVNTIAHKINDYFGGHSDVRITGKFRVGDIRHNAASINRIKSVLNYTSSVTFKDGLHRFLAWVETQPIEDSIAYQRSALELRNRGLMGAGRNS